MREKRAENDLKKIEEAMAFPTTGILSIKNRCARAQAALRRGARRSTLPACRMPREPLPTFPSPRARARRRAPRVGPDARASRGPFRARSRRTGARVLHQGRCRVFRRLPECGELHHQHHGEVEGPRVQRARAHRLQGRRDRGGLVRQDEVPGERVVGLRPLLQHHVHGRARDQLLRPTRPCRFWKSGWNSSTSSSSSSASSATCRSSCPALCRCSD